MYCIYIPKHFIIRGFVSDEYFKCTILTKNVKIGLNLSKNEKKILKNV